MVACTLGASCSPRSALPHPQAVCGCGSSGHRTTIVVFLKLEFSSSPVPILGWDLLYANLVSGQAKYFLCFCSSPLCVPIVAFYFIVACCGPEVPTCTGDVEIVMCTQGPFAERWQRITCSLIPLTPFKRPSHDGGHTPRPVKVAARSAVSFAWIPTNIYIYRLYILI